MVATQVRPCQPWSGRSPSSAIVSGRVTQGHDGAPRWLHIWLHRLARGRLQLNRRGLAGSRRARHRVVSPLRVHALPAPRGPAVRADGHAARRARGIVQRPRRAPRTPRPRTANGRRARTGRATPRRRRRSAATPRKAPRSAMELAAGRRSMWSAARELHRGGEAGHRRALRGRVDHDPDVPTEAVPAERRTQRRLIHSGPRRRHQMDDA